MAGTDEGEGVRRGGRTLPEEPRECYWSYVDSVVGPVLCLGWGLCHGEKDAV